MTKVKICGITSLEDANAAAAMGADFIGLNFYSGSPRYTSPALAAQIANEVRGRSQIVGVFVNEEAGRIAEIARTVGLEAIQLHGDEDEAFISDLRNRTHLTLIKAHRVASDGDIQKIINCVADAVLLDAFSTSARGGTGKTFDWNIAKLIASAGTKVFLAGGLNPDNVGEAVGFVAPYAVDVCSGVESAPGSKDSAKVQRFIEQAIRSNENVRTK